MATQTGLPEGLPVVAGAGDNAAAAIGSGLSHLTPGLGSVSLGTSGVIFAPLDAPTPDPEGRVPPLLPRRRELPSARRHARRRWKLPLVP